MFTFTLDSEQANALEETLRDFLQKRHTASRGEHTTLVRAQNILLPLYNQLCKRQQSDVNFR